MNPDKISADTTIGTRGKATDVHGEISGPGVHDTTASRGTNTAGLNVCNSTGRDLKKGDNHASRASCFLFLKSFSISHGNSSP